MAAIYENGQYYIGGGGGALDTLTDVNITNPSDSQVLKYNATSGKWENGTGGGGSSSLDGLSDVALTTPANNEVLKYNSTTQKWENGTGGAADIDDLTNVDISNVQDGEVLKYNSTSQKWENAEDSGDSAISALSDVVLTGVQDKQLLKYNATLEKWENADQGNIGHIVVNQSGTASAQRSKLRFINAIIKDDAENDATVVIAGTGTKLDDVTGATASSTAGVKKISVSWTDPNDMVEGGITLAEWAGTLVVRKEGSAPESKEDGTVIVNSQVRNEYAVTGYEDDTVNYGITYYYRFFPYTDKNIYTDGSSINASVSKATISIPSPTGNLTYDGTAQTMPFNNDSSLVSVSGNSATNAGNYTATAHLIDSVNNEWTDHTIADKSVSWSISKASITPPTISGSFIYDGTEKTADVSPYDSTLVSVTGITGTNVGSYTATMHLLDTENAEWSDHTTADKTVVWSITKATVTPPTVTGDYTYDGTQKTAVVSEYDSNIISIMGITGTNAGTYTATIHLIDSESYEWSDHTIADKTATWAIEKAKVLPPTVTGSFTYDGTEKAANVSTYDNTIISVTGITGTNAGTYTATLSLINSNYQWADETTADKTENWTIAKAAGSCELTPNSITLDADHLTGTATISSATGTVIGVQSSAPEDVSATLNGNDIVVTAIKKKGQTVTVLVQVAESANYEEAEIELPVICDFMAIVTWADGTDAEIAAMLEAHYAGKINIYDYWDIGDERRISLSSMPATSGIHHSEPAQTVTMVLMNKGGKTLTTPVNGHTECAFVVGQKNALNVDNNVHNVNTTSGGWNGCALRTWCNSSYKNAFPNTLIGIFKEHQNITADGSGSTTATSNDYFALPSEKEVFGSTSHANATAEANNNRFEYYQINGAAKKQGDGGDNAPWWERSPSGAYTYCYVFVWGDAQNTEPRNDGGIAPFGCI